MNKQGSSLHQGEGWSFSVKTEPKSPGEGFLSSSPSLHTLGTCLKPNWVLPSSRLCLSLPAWHVDALGISSDQGPVLVASGYTDWEPQQSSQSPLFPKNRGKVQTEDPHYRLWDCVLLPLSALLALWTLQHRGRHAALHFCIFHVIEPACMDSQECLKDGCLPSSIYRHHVITQQELPLQQ